ncbi:MAG: hypothetical protein H6739_11520 [Alphaproteobacteria bacterium]|nr:hypothetical protein [Alphaproteobacteria bacterium]
MNTLPAQQTNLLRNRNRVVAQSFYRQLRSEGFTPEQVIELSTTLLALVTEDMQEGAQAK